MLHSLTSDVGSVKSSPNYCDVNVETADSSNIGRKKVKKFTSESQFPDTFDSHRKTTLEL